MSLEGKVALVTGGGRAIGRQIALRLGAAKAKVIVAARTADEIEKVAGEIRAAGGMATALTFDLADAESIKNLAEAALKAYGTLDILVNNAAAITGGMTVAEMPAEVWKFVIDTNLTGTFLLTQAVLPTFIEKQHGDIVMISSTAGRRGVKRMAAYCASKFGLEGLAQSLFHEVRRHNIRVMTVAPSMVDTSEAEEGSLREWGQGMGLRMEDVADAVIHALQLPGRAQVHQIELWGTNPD